MAIRSLLVPTVRFQSPIWTIDTSNDSHVSCGFSENTLDPPRPYTGLNCSQTPTRIPNRGLSCLCAERPLEVRVGFCRSGVETPVGFLDPKIGSIALARLVVPKHLSIVCFQRNRDTVGQVGRARRLPRRRAGARGRRARRLARGLGRASPPPQGRLHANCAEKETPLQKEGADAIPRAERERERESARWRDERGGERNSIWVLRYNLKLIEERDSELSELETASAQLREKPARTLEKSTDFETLKKIQKFKNSVSLPKSNNPRIQTNLFFHSLEFPRFWNEKREPGEDVRDRESEVSELRIALDCVSRSVSSVVEASLGRGRFGARAYIRAVSRLSRNTSRS